MFLFKNFLPKHKENTKKPDVRNMNNPDEKRKSYFILSSHYHPNKVDTNKFEMKDRQLAKNLEKPNQVSTKLWENKELLHDLLLHMHHHATITIISQF